MTDAFSGLLLSLILNAAAPAERIVCVPNADGGWECGKGSQAPAPRPLPPSATPVREAAPPPIYLMDPERMPSVVRESMERGDVRGAQEASRRLPPVEPEKPAAPAREEVAESPPKPEVVREPERAAAPEPTPEPVAEPAREAAPEPMPAPTPEPEPVAEQEVEPEISPPATPAPEPVADAAVEAPTEPVEAPAPRVQRSISSVARDASELLALAPDAYTVQLAAARNIQGFAAFRLQHGIAVEDTFVIKVKRGDEIWWLMLWRDFPNVSSARAAIAELPNSPTGIWPRRLAPLQAEVRATN